MNYTPRLLVATANPGKLREIAPLLGGLGVRLLSLHELGSDAGFAEDGSTFLENAIKKALHYHRLHGLPTIADDSGLVIDALNGEPGVHSSRYLGADVSHHDKMIDVLQRMSDVPDENRGASFCSSIALAVNDRIFSTITKKVYGVITHKMIGSGGFGYDPIFHSPELGCTFAQADGSEKNRISHRGKAVASLLNLLETHTELRKILRID